MCISCGCGNPEDNHGDGRNITLQTIDQAAQAAGTTRDRAMQNIMQGIQHMPTNSRQGQQTSQSQQSEPLPMQNRPGASDQASNPQNNDAQAQGQPGTYTPNPGHESGTAWGQDAQNINYQPPEDQKHY